MKLIDACAASGCVAPFTMHQLSIHSSVSGAPKPHSYWSGFFDRVQSLSGVAVPHLRQRVVALGEPEARVRVEHLDVLGEVLTMNAS